MNPLSPLRPWMVLALVVAAYAGVVGAGFVWDDQILILTNRTLLHPTFDAVFRQDFWCCSDAPPSHYYRPLTTLSFVFDRLVGGVSPRVGHLQNLFWHLSLVACVERWLRPRLGWRAMVAALIVGLHPVQSEAVVWIAARNDLLAAVGVVGAMMLADGVGRGRLVAAGVVGLAAALSKESAVTLPVLGWLAWRAQGRSLSVAQAGALMIGPLIAVLLRLQVHWQDLPDQTGGHLRDLDSWLRTLTFMVGWLSVPWPLTAAANFLHAWPTGWQLAGCALTILGAAVIVRRGAGGWLLWATVAVAPSLMGVDHYGIVGERYLYLSMVGVAVAVASALPVDPSPRRLAAGLGAWTLLALGVLYVRVPDWGETVSLFEAADRRFPDSMTRGMYANALEDIGEPDHALRLYAEAIDMEPMARFACTRIAPLALRHASDPRVPGDLLHWADRGCKTREPFLDDASVGLFLAGWVDAARELVALEGDVDKTGRVALTRAALATLDGDLLGAVGPGLESGAELGEWRARTWDLLRRRGAAFPVPDPSGGLAPAPAPL